MALMPGLGWHACDTVIFRVQITRAPSTLVGHGVIVILVMRLSVAQH